MNKNGAPKWLPDWKDEAAYPNVDKWEFLRRSLDYQKAFQAYERNDFNVLNGASIMKVFALDFPPPDPADNSPGPLFLPTVPKHAVRLLSYRDEVFEPWAIDDPFNEPTDFLAVVDAAASDAAIVMEIKQAKRLILAKLRFKGEPSEKKPRKRKRDADLKRFLRLLDAAVLGVCQRDMAKVVYPDTFNHSDDQAVTQVQNASATARQLRDGGYKKL